MYEIKKQIYLDLTKNQKSALCNFLRALVKKSQNLSVDKIFEKFIEDEKYYLNIKSSNFEFLTDIIDDEKFLNDTKKYLKECKKYYDYKESQRPLIEANKAFEKKKRKFLQEIKMSKETPTKKQLYYYNKLCKKYNIEKIELTSKLEARNEIDKIINEHQVITPNVEEI
jgi:predicted O-linked N-acetylglucosamine transferase (SPINDLY family)